VVQHQSHRRRNALVAAGVILLLILALGVCAAAGKPSLALDRSIAHRGEQVGLTASHLPANQSGTIELASPVVYRFAFSADSSGGLGTDITIPSDIGFGDHHVRLCWNGSCPLEEPLRIVAGAPPPASPTPGVSPAPALTPSPAPGSTPRSTANPTPTAPHSTANPTGTPRSTPGSTPNPTPKATPTSAPTPTPTPAPKPTPSPTPKPTPTPAASVTLTSATSSTFILNLLGIRLKTSQGKTSATFSYFTAGSASILVCQAACYSAGTVTIAYGANVAVTFNTPDQIVKNQATYLKVGTLTSNQVTSS
jgi:hypothetical protein